MIAFSMMDVFMYVVGGYAIDRFWVLNGSANVHGVLQLCMVALCIFRNGGYNFGE